MAFVIYTVEGKTSIGQYPLKKFTRIGADKNSHIVLLEAGIPDRLCVVELAKNGKVKVHCQRSATITLHGKPLNEGDVVEWKHRQSLRVNGGIVKLRLLDESEVSGVKPEKQDVSVRKAHQASLDQIPTRTRTSKSDGATRVQTEAEKKTGSNQAFQLTVIVLCVIACVGMTFLGSAKTEKQIDAKTVYYILDSDSLGNNVENYVKNRSTGEERKTFGDAILAKCFQNAYLQEFEEPEAALVAYQILKDRLTLVYRDRLTKKDDGSENGQKNEEGSAKVDEATASLEQSYSEAAEFIQKNTI